MSRLDDLLEQRRKTAKQDGKPKPGSRPPDHEHIQRTATDRPAAAEAAKADEKKKAKPKEDARAAEQDDTESVFANAGWDTPADSASAQMPDEAQQAPDEEVSPPESGPVDTQKEDEDSGKEEPVPKGVVELQKEVGELRAEVQELLKYTEALKAMLEHYGTEIAPQLLLQALDDRPELTQEDGVVPLEIEEITKFEMQWKDIVTGVFEHLASGEKNASIAEKASRRTWDNRSYGELDEGEREHVDGVVAEIVKFAAAKVGKAEPPKKEKLLKMLREDPQEADVVLSYVDPAKAKRILTEIRDDDVFVKEFFARTEIDMEYSELDPSDDDVGKPARDHVDGVADLVMKNAAAQLKKLEGDD